LQSKQPPLPTQVEKALGEKSIELLKQLAVTAMANNTTDAGFKTLRRR